MARVKVPKLIYPPNICRIAVMMSFAPVNPVVRTSVIKFGGYSMT